MKKLIAGGKNKERQKKGRKEGREGPRMDDERWEEGRNGMRQLDTFASREREAKTTPSLARRRNRSRMRYICCLSTSVSDPHEDFCPDYPGGKGNN